MKLLVVTTFCATVVISSAFAGPTPKGFTEERFEKDVHYETTLLSIEEKLKNIENSLSMQYAVTIHGKIDYYGRKIDNIEKELSRFQTYMRMELDKISENISSKNYKDDITKDRVIRKIDVIYERIDHKLGNIEGEIDLNTIKSQNGRDLIMSKLEKIEENFSIRDSDLEAELADAVAAIDDLKNSCSNIEESIKNATKETAKTSFKNNEKFMKKYHNQTITMLEKTNQTLYEELKKIDHYQEVWISRFDDNSNFLHKAKEEIDDYTNEYANKVINMYTDISTKNNLLYDKIDELGKISNSTKVEQQNALRALTVQLGRKFGKQSDNESLIANHKLDELNKNIDSKFDDVMLAQNLFLESCHRVQMDEAQLESQISIVLDKLIDTFENKTAVGPKDIHQLENLIRTHDSNIRRSIHHVTNNLLNVMHQMTAENEKYVEYFKDQKVQLKELDLSLQDILISGDNSKQVQVILEFAQGFQQQLNETHQEMLNVLVHINEQAYKISNPNDAKLQNMIDNLKNISQLLGSVGNKIDKSYLEYYFNRYNVDAIAGRFGEKLAEYIENARGTNPRDDKTAKVLLEVFGKKPQQPLALSSESRGNLVDNDAKLDALILQIFGNLSNNYESNNLLCFDAATNTPCNKTNNLTKIKNVDQESIDCRPNYVDLIDVRINGEVSNKLNCSLPNNTNKSNIKTNQSKTKKNCTVNYLDLIDVRLGDDPDCHTTNSEVLTNATHRNVKLSKIEEHNAISNFSSNYVDLIDVQSSTNVNNSINEFETESPNLIEGKGNTNVNSNETESKNNSSSVSGSNIQDTGLEKNTSKLAIVQNADTESESLQSNIFLKNLLHSELNSKNEESKSTDQSIKSSNKDMEALQRNVFLNKSIKFPGEELNEPQVQSKTTGTKTGDASTTAYNQQKNIFLSKIINSSTETNLNL